MQHSSRWVAPEAVPQAIPQAIDAGTTSDFTDFDLSTGLAGNFGGGGGTSLAFSESSARRLMRAGGLCNDSHKSNHENGLQLSQKIRT